MKKKYGRFNWKGFASELAHMITRYFYTYKDNFYGHTKNPDIALLILKNSNPNSTALGKDCAVFTRNYYLNA